MLGLNFGSILSDWSCHLVSHDIRYLGDGQKQDKNHLPWVGSNLSVVLVEDMWRVSKLTIQISPIAKEVVTHSTGPYFDVNSFGSVATQPDAVPSLPTRNKTLIHKTGG